MVIQPLSTRLIKPNFYYVIQPHKGSYMADTCKIIWQGLKKNQCICRGFNELHWLDRAKESFGGIWSDQRVEDVKAVVAIAPIFLTFILYWTIYGQVRSFFVFCFAGSVQALMCNCLSLY